MPADLPRGWLRTTVGEITAPRGMRARPEENPDLRYVGLEHIEGHTMRLLGTADAHDIRSSSLRFERNDVLYARMRPYLNKVWVAEFAGLCSSEFIIFPATEHLSSAFLALRLNADDFVSFANQRVSGERPRVHFNSLREFVIDVPPRAEQERIVERVLTSLSRLRSGEESARRARRRLRQYEAAALAAAMTGDLRVSGGDTNGSATTGKELLEQLLVTRRRQWESTQADRAAAMKRRAKRERSATRYVEPAPPSTTHLPPVPNDWTWCSLEQLGFITGGLTKEPRRAKLALKVPYLRVGNVYAGELRLDRVETIGVTEEELHKLLLYRGDLLIVEGNGSRDQIGRVALWDGSIENCVHQNHIIKARPIRKYLGEWVLSWLLSPPGRQQIELVASSSTGLYTLSISKVSRLPVPLPPRSAQAEIVAELTRRKTAAQQLKVTIDAQLERARDMRRSLLQQAFAGLLVPQDPADEPADALLVRMRSRQASVARRAKPKTRKTKPSASHNAPETLTMKQPLPTTDDLRAAWERIGREPDAAKLFSASRFAPADVAHFYALLREVPEIRKTFERSATSKSRARRIQEAVPPEDDAKRGRFRLVSLWLQSFKNLQNYEVHFDAHSGLDVLLGWNGTGKSNLFEALVIIFRDLHYWWEKNRWPDEPMKAYRLQYEIEEQLVEVSWDPEATKRPTVTATRLPSATNTLLTVRREDLVLPRFVFGYYSGPTNRLAEHFLPMKRDHYERLRKAASDDTRTLARLLEQRRFFCAEAHHAKYVLLAFSYKEDRKITEFLEQRLRIVGFESALFVIRRPRWAHSGSPEDFWGATGIMRRVMEKLRRFAVAPLMLEQTISDGYRSTAEQHFYFFLPDLESLHAFAAEYADARSFFLALESTDFSELIHDVKIQVRVKSANNDEIPITFRELSEGEQQLLVVLGLMRFTKSHQSLVLLDEPDTHLNPHWSVDYLKDLESVISDDNAPSPERLTSQLLLATHDPLVIASLLKEQIQLLKRQPQTLRCYSTRPSENPRGLGFTGILTSEMFGFRSDLDSETLNDLDNKVRLVAKEAELSPEEKQELSRIDRRLADAGYAKAFSDPYYAAFVRAWGRRYSDMMAGKQFLTAAEEHEIDAIARDVLKEAVAEVEKDVVG